MFLNKLTSWPLTSEVKIQKLTSTYHFWIWFERHVYSIHLWPQRPLEVKNGGQKCNNSFSSDSTNPHKTLYLRTFSKLRTLIFELNELLCSAKKAKLSALFDWSSVKRICDVKKPTYFYEPFSSCFCLTSKSQSFGIRYYPISFHFYDIFFAYFWIKFLIENVELRSST